MDDLREVVKVNDKGGTVTGSNEGADEHECPIEVVNASEEPRERHDGWRRLDLLRLVDLVLLLELLRRPVCALVEVQQWRLRQLGHLGWGWFEKLEEVRKILIYGGWELAWRVRVEIGWRVRASLRDGGWWCAKGEGLSIVYYAIYTKPKTAFLNCDYRQNQKPHLRNAAPSQTKAAF